jgi:hypothetical protein
VRRHVARHHRQRRHLRALADRRTALDRRAGADPSARADDDGRSDDALQANRHLDVLVAMVEVDDHGLVAQHGAIADLDAGVRGQRAPLAQHRTGADPHGPGTDMQAAARPDRTALAQFEVSPARNIEHNTATESSLASSGPPRPQPRQ